VVIYRQLYNKGMAYDLLENKKVITSAWGNPGLKNDDKRRVGETYGLLYRILNHSWRL